MKKLLILITILTSLMIVNTLSVNAETELVNYDITIYDNYKWDVDDGSYKLAPDWKSTSRILIEDNSIVLNNYNFTHILFFDKNNYFIGYVNPFESNGYENIHFIDETTLDVVIPDFATKFSLTADATISVLQFNLLLVSHLSEIEIADDSTFIEKLNELLDEAGLGTFMYILTAFLLLGGITFILAITHVNGIAIIGVDIALFILFTIFEWFNSWVVIIVALLLLISVAIMLKGGRSHD